MPKRDTSGELMKLARKYGWTHVSTKGDHPNFKHPNSRFYCKDRASKDVPVGRATNTIKKLKLEIK
jgi:predicted RNA binding protein YcfA (HicA-like mRNA interferase family)